MATSATDIDRATKASRTAELHPSAIVTTHLPMVRRLARSVFARVSGAVELEDLIQVGLASLIEAERTYVNRGEASFTTYATMRIRGSMIDETRKLATISRQALRRRRDLETLRIRLRGEKGREPTVAELAQSSGMSVRQYSRAVDAQQSLCFSSFDEVYADNNPSFADPAPSAEIRLEASLSAEALAAAIKDLPKRYQMVLQLFFVEELPLAEIGEILGVSPARICQIKKAAMGQLRGQLQGWA